MCAVASQAGVFGFGRFGLVGPVISSDLGGDLVGIRAMAISHATVG